MLAFSINSILDKLSKFSDKAIDKITAAMPTVFFALLIYVVGIVFSRFIVRFIGKILNKAHVDPAATSFLKSFIRIILYTIVVVITLSTLNVPMTSIVAIIGAAGLAVSLSLQSSLSNLAGGFIILFSKPFKAGDIIETEGSVGTVQSINILYTKITTVDNKTTYIPNGKISNAKIINYTDTPTRRLDMTFNISYDSDFDVAITVINAIATENPKILSEPLPFVRLGDYKERGMEIICRFWVNNEDYGDVFHGVSEAVKREFDKRNIKIPYNNLNINIKEKEEKNNERVDLKKS